VKTASSSAYCARVSAAVAGDLLLDLDVEGDRIAAGFEVVVEEAAGLVDHQVGIERQLRPLAQVLDGRGPEGQVGHEMGVHDVEVDPVGTGRLDAADGMGFGDVGDLALDVIDAGGKAADVRIVVSSGNRDIDAAEIKTMRLATFRPAHCDGAPCSGVYFHLNQYTIFK